MNETLGFEVVLGLLAVMAALATVARRLRIPYPILFVLGGLVLALIPAIPVVSIPPSLIFLIFLPPLLYDASVFISPRDLRRNLGPIALLAVGLVVVTMAAVGLVAHLVAGLAWAPAFVLGAVVSSTDPTVVAAIAEHVRLPRRVLAIIEGEGLFNDASGLVLYRIALAAVVSGAFSPLTAVPSFVITAAGGIAIGWAVGWATRRIRRPIANPQVEITISLLTPYAAWIPAEALGVSGVLAVVAAGIYIGQESLPELSPLIRLRGKAFWQVLTFLLEGLLFILVGSELRNVISALGPLHKGAWLAFVWPALAVTLTVVVLRIVWVFGMAYLSRGLQRILTEVNANRRWRDVALVAWSGMRGGDALVPALALPLATAGGAAFPGRGLLIFLTFAVILLTLCGQGLTLTMLVRRLGEGDAAAEIRAETTAEAGEEASARQAILRTALAQLDGLAAQTHAPAWAVDDLRTDLRHRLRDVSGPVSQEHRERDAAAEELLRRVLALKRETALRLRDQGAIDDDVLRDIERVLDLEEVELEEAP